MNLYINKLFENVGSLVYEMNEDSEKTTFVITGVQSMLGERLTLIQVKLVYLCWYERSLMVRWVIGSILHGVDPLSYFSFQPVLHHIHIFFFFYLFIIIIIIIIRAGRSSEVERSLMVRWVVGSILHGVDPLSYFSF